jgi:ADP-dependent NAD(P)H-hydrate dehydratase / NAD(P)H-hydrate epimerase
VETLMERAGFAVARAAVDLVGGAYGRRAVVVCGKGNNGGDGLVAARHLARWGLRVDVFLLSDPASGAPATKLGHLRDAGVSPLPFAADALNGSLGRADVVVDAMFGTGFRGSAEGPYAEVIEALDAAAVPVVAVDVPSGVEGDTGAVRGPAVSADITVTFGAPKVGDVLYPGAEHAGVLRIEGIGFPADLIRGEAVLVEPSDVATLLPKRPPETNKRASGVVLVVSGSRRMTGAPVLVARGAYRTGAGLVTVAVPESTLPVVQEGIAEATFLPLPEGRAGAVSEAAWEVLSERLVEVDAVAIGPGLSTNAAAAALARRVVSGSAAPLVVDADAINAFAGRAADLAGRASDAVITPHTGEFGRLFGMHSDEVVEDRLGFARKAAAETRAVVLLKGTRTVIAAPEGDLRINPTGSSALATGGTGDVLTGAVAACLARGLRAIDAATVAAFVHGRAGEIAGSRTGEGTVAGDVAEAIPEALRRVREGR